MYWLLRARCIATSCRPWTSLPQVRQLALFLHWHTSAQLMTVVQVAAAVQLAVAAQACRHSVRGEPGPRHAGIKHI